MRKDDKKITGGEMLMIGAAVGAKVDFAAKCHKTLFGWDGAETEIVRLRQTDISSHIFEKKYSGWRGAAPVPGDWLMEGHCVNVELCGEYGCEAPDFQNAFNDLGRVLAKTGAVVVAVAAPNVDYQGGWASFLLRGGDWSGIHPWEGVCDGCHPCLAKMLFLDDYAEHPHDYLHGEKCTECRAEESGDG